MTADTQLDTGLETAAEKVRDIAAEHAKAQHDSRALEPEVVESVRRAGFARHFVPSRWGGTEGTFGELTRAVVMVGEGCPATAWTASLAAYSARFAAHLPEEGHRTVWEQDPDVLVAAGLIPSGRAERADDGWLLSGRWNYVSGAAIADWTLVCAAAPDGKNKPELRFFMLPRSAYTVHETWDNVGMRATGSDTLVVDGCRVPSHMSFPHKDMLSGRNEVSSAPCHRVPFQAVGGLTFVGPAVGAATGALRACTAALAGKRRSVSAGLDVLRASARIDAARHFVEQNALVVDERAFTPALMARNERNAAFGAELLAEAVTELVRAAGTGGLSEARPLQRFWRDVVSATSHVALRPETAAAKNWSEVLIGAE